MKPKHESQGVWGLIIIVLWVGVALHGSGAGGCGGGSSGGGGSGGTTEDTTPPAVSACSPDNDATGVTKATAVTCTLSEALDETTVTTASVTLVDEDSNAVSGTVALSDDRTQVTFTPEENLSQNTRHCLTLGTGLTDEATNALASAHQTCFTTQCSSSSEFDDDNEMECFSYLEIRTEPEIEITETTPPGSLLDSVEVSDGALQLNHNTSNASMENAGTPFFFKPTSGDFSIELHVINGFPSNDNEVIDIFVYTPNESAEDFVQTDGATVTAFYNSEGGGLFIASNSIVNLAGEQTFNLIGEIDDLYVKITLSGTTVTCFYKTSEAAEYTLMRTAERTGEGDELASGGELIVGFATQTNNTLGLFAPVIDSFRFLSGNATDQE